MTDTNIGSSRYWFAHPDFTPILTLESCLRQRWDPYRDGRLYPCTRPHYCHEPQCKQGNDWVGNHKLWNDVRNYLSKQQHWPSLEDEQREHISAFIQACSQGELQSQVFQDITQCHLIKSLDHELNDFVMTECGYVQKDMNKRYHDRRLERRKNYIVPAETLRRQEYAKKQKLESRKRSKLRTAERT